MTSEEADAKKPSRVIFDYASRKTGAAPSNSIMIGDHFEADVVGAIDSGWKAVLFEPDKPRMSEPDFVHILELQELKEFL
jgi:putative hydrolase of the HAD superfamily